MHVRQRDRFFVLAKFVSKPLQFLLKSCACVRNAHSIWCEMVPKLSCFGLWERSKGYSLWLTELLCFRAACIPTVSLSLCPICLHSTTADMSCYYAIWKLYILFLPPEYSHRLNDMYDAKSVNSEVVGPRVYKVVLTGGPCGGKTTGQARLANFFETLGWKVRYLIFCLLQVFFFSHKGIEVVQLVLCW